MNLDSILLDSRRKISLIIIPHSSMPFSHGPISSMASLSSNPLGLQQQQHAQHKYEHTHQQYHQRSDDMTPPSTYQCHMSRLNIPSPSLQSLHQVPHSGLSSLQNHHTYSSTSSSPHSTPLEHPTSSTPPSSSSIAPPSSMIYYDSINIGGYPSRLSPCNTNENYQLNGASYVNSNGSSGRFSINNRFEMILILLFYFLFFLSLFNFSGLISSLHNPTSTSDMAHYFLRLQ